ncbi:hypothetical protein SAMN06265337_0970 [Hymenobacter gelipurpurascens]|uniref:Uncharacterized protein n=1 Tax=Hymenobacter gelipurpurascens TaxID=89968 RepID=A0A212TDJ8_9BACT|nr:hypothetical protein [Hymenobacter gelipurpurascens]SNC63891.1 hypothetical protein SAMN06265337_0970 [Hymenobacter gelipurpurascens]
MKKLLFVALLVVVSIVLTLVLRRPPPVPAPLATAPIIRKSEHMLAPAKHVRTLHGLPPGRHRLKN